MRILHITPEAPGRSSGGQLVVLQSILSFSLLNIEVDYVGPHISNMDIRRLYNKVYELSPTKNWIKVLMILLCGEMNKSYFAWKRLDLDYTEYDAVYLEFTKQDYVIKTIEKKQKKLKKIVRVHNIEAQLSKTIVNIQPTIKNKIIASLTAKKEKYITEKADVLIALTENDKTELANRYNSAMNKIKIVPVCIEAKKDMMIETEKAAICHILITGSLWYGPNVDGINWFLDEVLKFITIPYKITIAGYRPNKDLKMKCNIANVEIIDSPEDLYEFYKRANLVVIPIFNGAGMKVKVADALAYGKPIVCTSFGLIGYEKIVNRKNIYIADDCSEFADCINSFWKLSDEDKRNIGEKAYELFKNNYSLDASMRLYTDILLDD